MQACTQLNQCNKISAGLSLSDKYPLSEKTEKLYFDNELLSGEGSFFAPLPGMHFGICGDLNIHSAFTKYIRCDVPVVVVFLLLNGCFQCQISGKNGFSATINKNMFLFGRCDEIELTLSFPMQTNYSHIGFIVKETFFDQAFGSMSCGTLCHLLEEAKAKGVAETTLFSGSANPDIISNAKQLYDMQVCNSQDLLLYRCAALHFFAKLFNLANSPKITSQVTLYEWDKHRIMNLKERIEQDYLNIKSTPDICLEFGMSFSKANKLFHALYGTSIAQHIKHCKMLHAHSMLLSKKLNVSECAFEIGYSNVSHFISAFKKHYQLTPKNILKMPTINQ